MQAIYLITLPCVFTACIFGNILFCSGIDPNLGYKKVEDLQPAVEYQLYAQCESSDGMSEPSEILTFTTLSSAYN